MAHHLMGRTLAEVRGEGHIDELDSISHEVLAALFSIVEAAILQKLQQAYGITAGRKKALLEGVWDALPRGGDVAPAAYFTAETLGKMLAQFGRQGKAIAPLLARFQRNGKLSPATRSRRPWALATGPLSTFHGSLR